MYGNYFPSIESFNILSQKITIMTCRGGWLEVPDVPGAAEVIAAQEALIRYSRDEYLPNRVADRVPMVPGEVIAAQEALIRYSRDDYSLELQEFKSGGIFEISLLLTKI